MGPKDREWDIVLMGIIQKIEDLIFPVHLGWALAGLV